MNHPYTAFFASAVALGIVLGCSKVSPTPTPTVIPTATLTTKPTIKPTSTPAPTSTPRPVFVAETAGGFPPACAVLQRPVLGPGDVVSFIVPTQAGATGECGTDLLRSVTGGLKERIDYDKTTDVGLWNLGDIIQTKPGSHFYTVWFEASVATWVNPLNGIVDNHAGFYSTAWTVRF
jgi:hypothetical protein